MAGELISPEYLELQKQLHDTKGYGTSAAKRAAEISAAMELHGCVDILDYGCGKGTLKDKLGDCVREYDPAIPGKDADPEPADLVVCTDVLEHIEPDKLDDVLKHIHSKTKKRLYFTVSLCPAQKVLSDGRNAHLIVESANWWLERLGNYFLISSINETEGYELTGFAQPERVVGTVCAPGVMRDERILHVRQNVLKTPRRNPDLPVPAHDRVALIANYGPSLGDTFDLLVQQRKKLPGATLITVSGAHDFLRKKNLTPDIHVECDPRPHKGRMMRKVSKKTKYYMASCCHPDVIDQLKDQDVTLWHLFNGPESFEIRDIKSEETCSMIPGGGSVGLRTITLMYFLGFRNFITHGMDCSFADDGEQHAGAHTGKIQKTMKVRPAVRINNQNLKSDREYVTSPVLISYANHMLKDLRIGRYPECNFYWYGDGLFQEMLRLQNMQIQALEADAAARGIAPTYLAPRDYFSATPAEERAIKEEAA